MVWEGLTAIISQYPAEICRLSHVSSASHPKGVSDLKQSFSRPARAFPRIPVTRKDCCCPVLARVAVLRGFIFLRGEGGDQPGQK